MPVVIKLYNEVLGEEVNIPERPIRIVSFSPAATETLFMIGAGARVAGVSAFCARPPQVKYLRKVGSYNTVRLGLLDELKADLIFTVTGYQRDFALKLSKSRPVYPLELPVSVAGIADFVVKVGLVIGQPDAAREVCRALLRSLGEVRKATDMRGYVELDLGGPVSFGAHSYITDALKVVGCSSVYGGTRSEWVAPDLEVVKAEDPDVFIYEAKMYSKFETADLEKLIHTRRWETMRAAKSGNCFLTPGPLDFLAHHGPSFVTVAIPWLQDRMHEAAGRLP